MFCLSAPLLSPQHTPYPFLPQHLRALLQTQSGSPTSINSPHGPFPSVWKPGVNSVSLSKPEAFQALVLPSPALHVFFPVPMPPPLSSPGLVWPPTWGHLFLHPCPPPLGFQGHEARKGGGVGLWGRPLKFAVGEGRLGRPWLLAPPRRQLCLVRCCGAVKFQGPVPVTCGGTGSLWPFS